MEADAQNNINSDDEHPTQITSQTAGDKKYQTGYTSQHGHFLRTDKNFTQNPGNSSYPSANNLDDPGIEKSVYFTDEVKIKIENVSV